MHIIHLCVIYTSNYGISILNWLLKWWCFNTYIHILTLRLCRCDISVKVDTLLSDISKCLRCTLEPRFSIAYKIINQRFTIGQKSFEIGLVWFTMFNATFNNISAILWRSVLLVEETGVPGKYHRSVTSHFWNWKHMIWKYITENPLFFLLLNGNTYFDVNRRNDKSHLTENTCTFSLKFYNFDLAIQSSHYIS